ncbi:MAG: ribosomal protein L11 methyltransferase [Candidatus Muproteobacteria bacterium RBG_16_65_34]|uniref:Ribosomal protein L11 methyltransferase n=1 Tax=Candidatus Muproteobacteria bacterium RBG_16_65_34 TaxID=1817760 RepID=A0A1F6TNI1_9PROT|nr:MAG: ribosomal protein L11 methyltransferase [Candidatus Muproteobacteria bacterium RBG_16_65_34]
MPWLKLKLHSDKDEAERLAACLEECGAIAVTLEDAADEPVFEIAWERPPIWSAVRLTALFPEYADVEAVLAQVAQALGHEVAGHQTDLLADQDWACSWMAHYKPLQVGHNLWVCPSWRTPPDPTAINIVLDPGLAFGTGDHPTTALCLEWLSEQALAGKTVLDYGCGSGILAIAALKLGAKEAYAVDIDPQALAVTHQNAARNAVAERLRVLPPEDLAPEFAADIVVANILAGALIELAPQLKGRARPGGRLALSGILAEQADEVRVQYAPEFAFETRPDHGWVLLAGTRRVNS